MWSSNRLPPEPSIFHKIRILHQDIYRISEKLSKRDKLGIHSTAESLCVEILSLAIEAAFKPKYLKKSILETLRVKIEVMKHIVRSEHELNIVDEKTYLRISKQLVEISKMTGGWINFIDQNKTQKEFP